MQSLEESEALALRQDGFNLLLAPVGEESRRVWDIADQMGFFVLGKLSEDGSSTLTTELAGHASCLGWLVTGDTIPAGLARAPLLGVVVGAASPTGADFLAVPAGERSPEEGELPVLLLGGRTQEGRDRGQVVLGAVEQSV